MWKAIKWQGKYFNVYVDNKNSENIKIMYPPKDLEFIKKHRALMRKKGYEVIEITGQTYTYRKINDGRC